MNVPRILLTLVALWLTIVPHVVDWTPTHVFHPGWTGHARMHMVWLLFVNSSLGVLCLYLLWAKGEHEESRFKLAGLLELIILGAFFVAAALVPTYDGALSDVHGGVAQLPGGIDANVAVFSIALALVVYAMVRGRRT